MVTFNGQTAASWSDWQPRRGEVNLMAGRGYQLGHLLPIWSAHQPGDVWNWRPSTRCVDLCCGAPLRVCERAAMAIQH